jgi:hypothetical protein
MHLQMSDHRVRNLPDHHVLERSGNRNEYENEDHAYRDQRSGEQGSPLVSQQVSCRDFEEITH